MQKKRTIQLFIVLIFGLVIGWVIRSYNTRALATSVPISVRENSTTYKFINPLIFSRVSKDLFADEFKGLNDSLNSYITLATNDKKAENISAYYRDLNSGDWTGVNEEETYEPASMLKVLVMIGTLKHALQDPTILTKNLYYSDAIDQGQYYKPNENLSVGYHSVKDLVEAMIVDSNNGAAKVLLTDQGINAAFQDVYKAFGLPSINSPTTTDFMSARSYSVVFRSLYDSSYLTWDLSDQAMAVLAGTGFSKGIVSGVPIGTIVAHKFGEYTKVGPDGNPLNHELHDCGVVYYPEHPYLICIMTRGQNFNDLEKIVSDLSKIMYDYVSVKNKAGA